MNSGRKNLLLTFSIVVPILVIGVIVFINWQSSTEITQTANSASLGLPVSGDVEEIKRPTLEKGEANWISIPDREIETPIVFVEEATEEAFQPALENGVVLYPGTSLPGERGNPYIFGHSSDYFWKAGDYKEVFKSLVDIPLETEVRVTNEDGELFIYRVIETKIVGPKEVSVLDQFNNERYLLTLQTSYPVGTALKRYIAVTELDELATFGP
ncbi:sortase [Patescibacteria group bacterium]